MARNVYESPLISRYASKEMLYVFSPDFKFTTWRELWIALAECERELGLPITKVQINELKKHKNTINYDVATKREAETRHDVMSHVYAFGKQCPKAAPIIHLGATSAYVGDNTDLIQIKEATKIIQSKLLKTIELLSKFAEKYKDMPTLGFTHFQPAQLTTVGKRATLWIQDFLQDLYDLEYQISQLRFLGVKGTTGTQASFLSLFNGNHYKVKQLDKMVSTKMGFEKIFEVSGQTYPRKLDAKVLSVLSGIAESAHKMTNDIRLLQNLKELEEPFGKKQIGSSAMAYKRNPMRSERIASLARFVMSLENSVKHTAATQWFERTLDDSANKRLAVAESFLAADSILMILTNICSNFVVYPKMINRRIKKELPFMATENILMEAVKKGGNRQELHEKIRVYSMEAAKQVKIKGKDNNLLELIAEDSDFNLDFDNLKKILNPSNFIGRAPEQVSEFLKGVVKPELVKRSKMIYKKSAKLHV